MSDLVRGRFPVSNPLLALFGQTANAVNSNVPARSNIEMMPFGALTDGALAGTGVGCAVPIPVEPGMVVSKVSIFTGATAASTPTHSFAALYGWHATAPPLIAQTVDATTAAIAASGKFDFTLATPVQITTAHAPYGYIYVSVVIAGTTIPTAAVLGVPTAVGYKWTTTGPLFLSATHGSSLTDTAPATIASPAAKAVAPIVLVS